MKTVENWYPSRVGTLSLVYIFIFQFGHAEEPDGLNIRGLGTDIALVSSMVFLAQFILSLCMGSLVHLAGNTVTIVIAASVLSFCGGVCATQVTYLDL